MAGKSIFDNLRQMDTSYLLDPSVVEQKVEEIEKESSETTEKLALDALVPFKNHPFKVNIESEKFQELLESIKEYGVLQPIFVRKSTEDGKYEIIAGHCRAEAARLCGMTEIPAKVIELDDLMATAIMAHTNIYGRDKILISEKAKAYRMCLDEEKKAGKTRKEIAENIGAGVDSVRQVQRYVRLSYLTDDFLDLVDCGKLSVQVGTELAFIEEPALNELYRFYTDFHQLPTLEQAKQLRNIFTSENHELSYERIISVLASAPKPKVINKVSFKTKEIESYFEEGTDPEEMTGIIMSLLAKYKAGEIRLEG